MDTVGPMAGTSRRKRHTSLHRMLNELDKLARAATPGPWWSEVMVVEAESCLSASLKEAGKSTTIEETLAEVMASQIVVADCSPGLSDRPLPEVESNARFIAAANPDTVLKLIAVARAAKECVEWGPAHEDGESDFVGLERALTALEESDPR